MHLPHESAVSFLGIYTREIKTCSCENLYADVHGGFIYKIQKWETAQMSFNWQMDKMGVGVVGGGKRRKDKTRSCGTAILWNKNSQQ